MQKIHDVCDTFNVYPLPKHFAAALPSERPKLLRYLWKYLKECERQEMRIPSQRHSPNG